MDIQPSKREQQGHPYTSTPSKRESIRNIDQVNLTSTVRTQHMHIYAVPLQPSAYTHTCILHATVYHHLFSSIFSFDFLRNHRRLYQPCESRHEQYPHGIPLPCVTLRQPRHLASLIAPDLDSTWVYSRSHRWPKLTPRHLTLVQSCHMASWLL